MQCPHPQTKVFTHTHTPPPPVCPRPPKKETRLRCCDVNTLFTPSAYQCSKFVALSPLLLYGSIAV